MLEQNVKLEVLGPCNYNCWYCGKQPRWPEPHLHDLDQLDRIYTLLDARGSVATMLAARGTEPALHPQMLAIARRCTASGRLTIMTNLSLPVEEWLFSPHNCTLMTTIHPETEDDWAGFLARVQGAVLAGYDIRAKFLVGTARPTAPPQYQEALSELGLTLEFHRLKQGDAASSLAAVGVAGAVCMAGYNSFYISHTTALWRCAVNRKLLDAPLAQPEPCALSGSCGMAREAA